MNMDYFYISHTFSTKDNQQDISALASFCPYRNRINHKKAYTVLAISQSQTVSFAVPCIYNPFTEHQKSVVGSNVESLGSIVIVGSVMLDLLRDNVQCMIQLSVICTTTMLECHSSSVIAVFCREGELTHWGLVTPYGDSDLGQHWFR